jgi:hypothetical protein
VADGDGPAVAAGVGGSREAVNGADDGAGVEARCPEGGGVLVATRGDGAGAVAGASRKISSERVANPVATAMAP